MRAPLELALVVLVAAAGDGHAIAVIDTLAVAQGPLADSTGAGVSSNTALSTGILGGYRDLHVIRVSGGGTSTIGVSAGALSFSSGIGSSAVGVARWDGANTGAAIDGSGLGGIDLVALLSPLTALSVVVTSVSSSLLMEFLACDNQATCSSLSTTVGTPGTYLFPLAGFGNGIDFSHLGALQLNLKGDAVIGPLLQAADADADSDSVDVTLSFQTGVPEPAPLALVGAALLASLGARQRRKTGL